MDELTPMGTADVVEATQDNIRRYVLEPRDLGIKRWATLPDFMHPGTSSLRSFSIRGLRMCLTA